MTLPRPTDRALDDEVAAQQLAEDIWWSLSQDSRTSEALIPTMRRVGPMTAELIATDVGHPTPSPAVWKLVVRKIERQQRRLLEPAKASP